MIRRRRPTRETVFGFDSFLDIVANVVGIIIRLILVAWVGARSYQSIQALLPEPAPRSDSPVVLTPPLSPPDNPLPAEIGRHQMELQEAQKKLVAQLARLDELRSSRDPLQDALAALDPRRRQLDLRRAGLEFRARSQDEPGEDISKSLTELQKRQQRLTAEIHNLEKQPDGKKLLRYHTPVSRPVDAEEVFFECSQGRVTYIEVPTMIDEVKQRLREKGEMLRSRWEVTDVTRPVGPFRLRYTIARQRSIYDALFDGGAPGTEDGYAYGLAAWELEPILPVRGETAEVALSEGSTFRRIVNVLATQPTVATFWVYPDSFELFRQLRDFLYERNITVAGRPLPQGAPIRASINGSRSRGQ